MKILMTIEGEHSGESYESSHSIYAEDIKEYLEEFLQSYKENPLTAKFSLQHCSCCCDDTEE